jgi:hypothetical protein
MVPDDCHPSVSLPDWNAFRNGCSPYLFEEVLDRSSLKLPSHSVPLARGGAIASQHLLTAAGYCPGAHRARHWSKTKQGGRRTEIFKKHGINRLIITLCGPAWRITWDKGPLNRPHPYKNFALVYLFGSTPVLTRKYQEATYLADMCWERCPTGLSWVHECPDDVYGAIRFAHERDMAEAGFFSPVTKVKQS